MSQMIMFATVRPTTALHVCQRVLIDLTVRGIHGRRHTQVTKMLEGTNSRGDWSEGTF